MSTASGGCRGLLGVARQGQTGAKERTGFLLLSSNFFSTFPPSSFPQRYHPPSRRATFPSLFRSSSLSGLAVRYRVARPLYSLRPFNSIATLFIRWRAKTEVGRAAPTSNNDDMPANTSPPVLTRLCSSLDIPSTRDRSTSRGCITRLFGGEGGTFISTIGNYGLVGPGTGWNVRLPRDFRKFSYTIATREIAFII